MEPFWKSCPQPEKARSARRFLAYYLPTAVRCSPLTRIWKPPAPTAEPALAAQVEQNAGTIARAFEAQLDSLFAGQVLDVPTDLKRWRPWPKATA